MKKFDIFLPQRQYDIFLQKKIPIAEILIQTLPVRLTMTGKYGNHLAVASSLDGELVRHLLRGDLPFQILTSTSEADLCTYNTAKTYFALQTEAEPIIYLPSGATPSGVGLTSQPASLGFACYVDVHDVLGVQTYAAEGRVSPSLCPVPAEIGLHTSAAATAGVELFETAHGGFAIEAEIKAVLRLYEEDAASALGFIGCAEALVVRFRKLYEIDEFALENLDEMTLKDLDYITA